MKKLITILFLVLFGLSSTTYAESSLPKCQGDDYKQWTNCYAEIIFPRNEYKGEWKDGKFEGKGTLTEAWGGVYTGDFKNNLAHGFGRQEEKDGSWWEGEFKNDLLHGKGIFVNYDGATFEGNFFEGFLHGQGIYTKLDGTKATGNFVKDYLNGQGKWEYANGDIYVGSFKDDNREGKGEQTYKNGNKYVGSWVKDLKNGYGVYTWSNGDKYVGQWKDGSQAGKGIFTWFNGDKYEGDFLNGRKHGKGKYTSGNGNIYVGDYLNDDQNGKGIYTWTDGDKYEGDFINGYRTGKGKYTYSSGSIYEGEFEENHGHGQGIFIYSDGSKYAGEFEESYEHGQGTMVYENGDKYVGQWKEGYEHGQGTMEYANGDRYVGLWEDGKKAEGKTTLAKFTTDENYYALIIGNNNYEHWEDLDAAENDARGIEKILKEKYAFETTLLTSENYNTTANAIIKFTKNRETSDNLLIYYAGHGELEKEENRGYWIPTDAGLDQDSKWLGNDSVRNWIRSSKAGHILLIVDSCFSGMLMKGNSENKSIEKLTQKSIDRNKTLKARLVFTSGGVEPVVDSDGGNHSYFADKLIRTLRNSTGVIQSLNIFQSVKQYVIDNAPSQTPRYSSIHGTFHDGGEFLFFPKN